MYSSAAKSCAYVAEATPWSPLCTALVVCMRVCVGGVKSKVGEGIGREGQKALKEILITQGSCLVGVEIRGGWGWGNGPQQQRL